MAAPADLQTIVNDLLFQVEAATTSRLAGNETSAQLAPTIASLASLKALNRSAGIESRRARQVAADAKQRMDSAQLGLQNLQYERQFLEREIRKCEEYQSEYQNVDLETLDLFMTTHSDHQFGDEHELMLERLRHELAQRQTLEAQKKELLSQKAKLTKDNETKKAKLDELEKLLDGFLESARTIQTQMSSF